MEVSNIEKAVALLLHEVEGKQSDREGLKGTPLRVAKMYREIFNGYEMKPEDILERTFADDVGVEDDIYQQGMVVVKDIQFYSHCEHHMVPFFGKVHIGYIPNKEVVGLSKLCRLVECYAHRLQIQERMTHQIIDAIDKCLKPQGVMVIVEAEHLCMKMRGVKNPSSYTITSAVRGVFTKPEVRNEFQMLIGK